MHKAKMLYLMHVHWGWIKQRPHFIAESLSKEYDITVCFLKSYRYQTPTLSLPESHIKLKELFILPFSRYLPIAAFNHWLTIKQLSNLLNNYDIIWLTHPRMYDLIMNKLSKDAYVVYDCMDDALEFPHITTKPFLIERLATIEYQLLKRSNTIFASANHLKNILLQRYNINKKVHVINNAINIYTNDNKDDQKLSPELRSIFLDKKIKKIVYIGTISEWFDFKLILKSIEQFNNITYILIGPAEVSIPQHDKIVYLPPVDHKKVHSILELSDALVMPFLINDLIKSVNPVKVYEYIYAAKPAIICNYQETRSFSNFVHLYNTNEEYFHLIGQVATGKLDIKCDRENYLSYARQNTWFARASKMREILNKNIYILP